MHSIVGTYMGYDDEDAEDTNLNVGTMLRKVDRKAQAVINCERVTHYFWFQHHFH